ncbi:MAG: hypothetical protein IJY39_13890 [Clostridia bacterium]|nr:hypothetical protein [Clostridia bacterium]
MSDQEYGCYEVKLNRLFGTRAKQTIIGMVILFLLFCLILTSCGGLRNKVYDTLDDIDVSAEYTSFLVMVPHLSEPSLYTEQYPDEYKEISSLGKKAVPFILDYIEGTDLNTVNAAFFVCCCYGILELDGWITNEPLGNVEAHVLALRQYLDIAK